MIKTIVAADMSDSNSLWGILNENCGQVANQTMKWQPRSSVARNIFSSEYGFTNEWPNHRGLPTFSS
jgi:hypothetical protein